MKTVFTLSVQPNGIKRIVATSEKDGKLMSFVSDEIPKSLPGFPEEILASFEKMSAEGTLIPGYQFAMEYSTPDAASGEVVTVTTSTLRENNLTHLWAGSSILAGLISLAQDAIGQERYLQLVRTAWVPAWISVPMALALLAFSGYMLTQAKEKLTLKPKSEVKLNVVTQSNVEEPTDPPKGDN